MRIEPEASAAGIVLIGSFNPRIFRPKWFKAMGIIGDADAESAKVRIVHEAVTAFSLDWANLHVDQNRFGIDTSDPPLIRIHDAVLTAFKQFLIHTPVYQLGINRTVHFSVGSFDVRDAIGKLLAPREPWGEWGPKISGDPQKPQLRGGMKSLLMSQLDRGDGYKGSINARVEPSALRPADGIFVEVNDHFFVGDDPTKILGSEPAMNILESEWSTSITRSEWIIDQVMALRERRKK
jgi:hypothetical protein